MLPLTSDLKKVRDHLDNKMRKCSPDLRKKPTTADWKSLAETTLNRVVLFNKRRSGEASGFLCQSTSKDPSGRRNPKTKCSSLWILPKRNFVKGIKLISSQDLVLADRGQKKTGEAGGEGRGGNEIWQNTIAWAESGPRVNCACPKSDML